MRANLKAALQERWETSLRERARLNPRSIVPVLDALLATAVPPSPLRGRSRLPRDSARRDAQARSGHRAEGWVMGDQVANLAARSPSRNIAPRTLARSSTLRDLLRGIINQSTSPGVQCCRVVITTKRRRDVAEVVQRPGEDGAVPVGFGGRQFPVGRDGLLGGGQGVVRTARLGEQHSARARPAVNN